MGLSHSPKIVTNGLVFAYDMGNIVKSWKGAPVTNEAKNVSNQVDWTIGNLDQAVSRSTIVPNESYYISSSSLTGTSFRIYFLNAVLTNGATYTVSYKYRIISGGPLFFANDWCDTGITRVTTDLGGGVFYETATGTRATYDVTYRFLDLQISNNTVVQIWDLQLELGSFATPYSSTRVRSNTQAILDLTGLNTINATSLTYNSNNTFSFNGSSNYISFPKSSSIVTGGSISLSLWAKWTTVGTTTSTIQVLVDNNHSASPNQGFYLQDRPDLNKSLTFSVSPLLSTVQSTFQVGDGNWHHITATNDTITSKIYIDGILNAQASGTGIISAQPNISIGNWGLNNSRFLNGNIAQISIYDRALSASEVSQNFTALKGRFGL